MSEPTSRELADLQGPSFENEPASSRASFDDVVRPVELADGGRPLHGQGRVDCEQAYAAHPSGFILAVAEALTGETAKSRRAVLVAYVRTGWHVRAEELARLGVEPPPRTTGLRYGRGFTARHVLERTAEGSE